MTLGAASLVAGANGWRIDPQPGPDLAAYLQGRPVDEVAILLPRLFNLCRMAQGTAAQLALGLAMTGEDPTAEVIRDHMARLFVTLRRAFGLAPIAPPAATPALFSPTGQMPCDLAGLQGWLLQDTPLAELGRAVQTGFPAGLGVTPGLPDPMPKDGAMENAPAQRQAQHPLMQAFAAAEGRSPLWRLVGVLIDLGAAMAKTLTPPQLLSDGTAVVQAARGSYFLRIGQQDGRVTGLHRITPTDHQLAPGGALQQALRTIPVNRPDLAAQLVALIDPCSPVTVPALHLREAHHA
jgi:hypothetical protein